MKTSIGLVVLALLLSACTAAVAKRDGDFSGQALPTDPSVIAECDRESRRFWNPGGLDWGRVAGDTSASIERDIQRRLYRDCLAERGHQAP